MKKKRWASYSKNLVESGVVDPSELSEMVGVSVETARRIINRYTGAENVIRSPSERVRATEEIVDISPGRKSVRYEPEKRLSRLHLGIEEQDVIPPTRGSLPIYNHLADNLSALEDFNASATIEPERFFARWLDRESSKLKLDRYLAFFGLRSEDLPIPPAKLRDAMEFLATNEEYTKYLTKYFDPQNVRRLRYKIPNYSFYLKGTLAKPSVVQYSYDTGSFGGVSYILDFIFQTDIFSEDPNSDQPWMLFSRKEDTIEQGGIRKRVFTFVGAQGILESFCTQQLLWICRSFPDMLYSDIRVLGDTEITPIESVLDATLS